MNLMIDIFTPCLEKTSTGEIVETSYSPAEPSDISKTKNGVLTEVPQVLKIVRYINSPLLMMTGYKDLLPFRIFRRIKLFSSR